MNEFDSLFNQMSAHIQVFGHMEITANLFPAYPYIQPDHDKFKQECDTRGYEYEYVNAMQARMEEKGGWYYRVKKK